MTVPELELSNILIGDVRSFDSGPKYLVLGLPHDSNLVGTHLRILLFEGDEELDYPISAIETDPVVS